MFQKCKLMMPSKIKAGKSITLEPMNTIVSKIDPFVTEKLKKPDSMVQLIWSYFRKDGHHIQFNEVTADTLRKAQKHPEDYKDLIVRVAGYSDYFNDLGENLQDEIIRRTEHEEF